MVPHTIAGSAHVQLPSNKLIPIKIIGHYSQPSQQSFLDIELQTFLKYTNAHQPAHNLILAGDFNRDITSMNKLLPLTITITTQTNAAPLITRR